jgi:quercetin dioxygenase-like cupin family protein
MRQAKVAVLILLALFGHSVVEAETSATEPCPSVAELPPHYHPGEEFVYVLEGSAVHVEQGKPDRILKAGDSYVIPPRAVHAPRGGPQGARAVVFRLHVEGQPERIPVKE